MEPLADDGINHGFGIGCTMKNSAVKLMGAAQFIGIYKISVVTKSHVSLDMADDDRLDVVGVFAASGGIAYMADSDAAVAQMGQLFLRKNFGYEAVAAVLPEKTVIRNSDAAAFSNADVNDFADLGDASDDDLPF